MKNIIFGCFLVGLVAGSSFAAVEQAQKQAQNKEPVLLLAATPCKGAQVGKMCLEVVKEMPESKTPTVGGRSIHRAER